MRRIYFLFIALTLSLGCMAQGFPPYRSGHRPPQHRSGNRPMREVNPEYKMTAETFVAICGISRLAFFLAELKYNFKIL